MKKSLSGFDLPASSIPPPTLEHLPSLEWLRAKEWPCLVGPPAQAKATSSSPPGTRPAMLVTRSATPPRPSSSGRSTGLADTSVDKVYESALPADAVIVSQVGFAPLDDTGPQLLFRFVAAANQRGAVASAGHWRFEEWGRFLPNETTAVSCSTVCCTTASWLSPTGSCSGCERRARQEKGPKAKAS